MQSFDYWGAVRRRWPLILILAVVGAVVAVLIPASRSQAATSSTGFLQPRYAAGAILSGAPSSQADGGPTVSPQGVVAAVHSAAVEVATASRLHLDQGPSAVGAAVTLGSTGKGSAQLTATAATPGDAANLANAYAASLLSYLANLNAAQLREQVAAASTRMNGLQQQLNAVTTKLAPLAALPTATNAPERAVLQSQRQALNTSYQAAYQQYTQLSSEPPPGSGLAVVQPASPATALAVKGQKRSVLDERRVRGPIGLAIGLVLGLLLALLLEQVNQRISGRRDAETTLGLPVLAEIPRYRLTRSMRDVVVTSAPLSRSAEGYRTLRTLLLAQTPLPGGDLRARLIPPALGTRDPQPWGDPSETTQLPVARNWPGRSSEVIALVCPEALPTRSVAVANTAAAFAEYGHSVLVATVEPGSAQGSAESPDGDGSASGPGSGMTPAGTVRPTKITGVYRAVVSEVSGPSSPDTLLALLGEVEHKFDEVIVDTPPAVFTHDAAAVAGLVDHMVLVCQAHWTTRPHARVAVELLRRVGAPLLGVLLTQSDASGRQRLRRSGYRSASWTAAPDQQAAEAAATTPGGESTDAAPVPEAGRAGVGL